MNKIALVVGGTGLIGKALVERLCDDNRYQEVKLLVRSIVKPVHPKVKVITVDFSNLGQFKKALICDDLFCCIGTTIAKAGSESKFEEVDYFIPKHLAEIAAQNSVEKFLLISSLGADEASSNFYLRTKGRAEQAVIKSGIANYLIVRPSLLTGKRSERRIGEFIGKVVLQIFKPILRGPFRKYRPVSDFILSSALVGIANSHFKNRIFESPELFQFKSRM